MKDYAKEFKGWAKDYTADFDKTMKGDSLCCSFLRIVFIISLEQ